MIRFTKVIQKALCDACGAPLSTKDQEGPDGKPHAAHYGKLINSFGWGSDLDSAEDALSSIELCEKCYVKCFQALNLPECTHCVPSHLRVYLRSFWLDNDKPCEKLEPGRQIYHAPEWVCIFCDWKESGRGYSLPDHRCENLGVARAKAVSLCKFCRGIDGTATIEIMPSYSERRDGWIHHKKDKGESVDCAASDIYLGRMCPGTRVDPKWLARVRADEEALKALARKKGKEGAPDGVEER